MGEKTLGVTFNRSGPGLKEKLGMADTGSVVNSVKGTVSYGKIDGQADFNGRSPSRNPMVSANGGRKHRA